MFESSLGLGLGHKEVEDKIALNTYVCTTGPTDGATGQKRVTEIGLQ